LDTNIFIDPIKITARDSSGYSMTPVVTKNSFVDALGIPQLLPPKFDAKKVKITKPTIQHTVNLNHALKTSSCIQYEAIDRTNVMGARYKKKTASPSLSNIKVHRWALHKPIRRFAIKNVTPIRIQVKNVLKMTALRRVTNLSASRDTLLIHFLE